MRQRHGFHHWITAAENLPLKLEDAELEKLYHELRAGSKEAEERIIKGHIRLGLSKVAEFGVRSPSKIDDMASEMLLTLTEATQKIAEGAIEHHEERNITGYLMAYVRGRLMRFASTDGILRISLNAYKRFVEKYGTAQGVIPLDNSLLTRKKVGPVTEYKELLEVVDLAITKVQSEIQTDRLNLVRSVIELRVDGLRDPAIGEKLDLSRQRVQQIRVLVQNAVKESLA